MPTIIVMCVFNFVLGGFINDSWDTRNINNNFASKNHKVIYCMYGILKIAEKNINIQEKIEDKVIKLSRKFQKYSFLFF